MSCKIEGYKLDTIHIAFGCDDNYVKHLSVALLSLLEHIDPRREIVLHVMIVSMSEKNKAGLRAIKPPTKYLNYAIISAWKKEMQEH
jgi:lipopolysaccharide biosynthesis glycosyltransferase